MKLLAVDGNSILNRAYFGIKALTTKNGEFTNGIYGFLTILLRLLEEVQPDAVACAFDLKAPTFRHQLYDGYKAGRKGMPQELAGQLQPLKELLTALGFPLVSLEGYEADDLLGTLAAGCSRRGAECVIATGDRDSLQLVGEHVTVRLATTKMGQPVSTLYDVAAIREKYGVSPRQLIEVKALMGDSSDNIPGVSGIGEKTALELISRYGDVETIYRELDSLELKPSVRKKLAEGKNLAYLSRKLGEICCDAPIDSDPAHYLRQPVDQPQAAALFARLEMFKLMERWGVDPAAAAQAPALPQEAPEPPAPPLAVAVEPADYLEAVAQAGGAGLLYTPDGQGGFAALAVVAGDRLLLLGPQALEPLLQLGQPLRVWSGKPLHKFLYRRGQRTQNIRFDGELAAYLLSPNSTAYDLRQLAAQYGVAPRALAGEIPAQWQGLAEEAALFGGLCGHLEREIAQKGQERLLEEIELPLARVLAGMECEGFALDTAALQAYGAQLDSRLGQLEQQLYGYAGHPFNLNSPKQLGEVLFVDLGLPAKKKTKSGYSTSAEVLEGLRGKHPIIEGILEYRKLAKLKSTYVEGLLKLVDPDGRVRSTFQQTETRTGRISSTEPNLQNIPVRTAEGSRLRAFFKARPGWLLVDADYSQIELRVLADLADDENMIQAFRQGEDIHTATAAQVFGMPRELVTPAMRSRAKAVNFGIVYGIGAYSLSQDIGVTVAEADAYIKSYLDHYAGVRRYMEETIQFARENGYVKTLFGRRRYLPELAASNKVTQAFGERVARNTPIQGTAADIIKIAMIRVWDRLEREGLQARLILQVHDELLVEAPREEAQRAAAVLKEEMEHAIQLKVPLEADTNMGENWLEAK